MALHPIFALLIRRPELLADHAAGYAGLLREETASAGAALAQRALAWVTAVLALFMFLLLAGVAVMLAALTPQFHWALVFVPGTAGVLAVVAVLLARQQLTPPAFTEVRAQLEADLETLRALGAAI